MRGFFAFGSEKQLWERGAEERENVGWARLLGFCGEEEGGGGRGDAIDDGRANVVTVLPEVGEGGALEFKWGVVVGEAAGDKNSAERLRSAFD